MKLLTFKVESFASWSEGEIIYQEIVVYRVYHTPRTHYRTHAQMIDSV